MCVGCAASDAECDEANGGLLSIGRDALKVWPIRRRGWPWDELWVAMGWESLSMGCGLQ
jgi:hypothetical protein